MVMELKDSAMLDNIKQMVDEKISQGGGATMELIQGTETKQLEDGWEEHTPTKKTVIIEIYS